MNGNSPQSNFDKRLRDAQALYRSALKRHAKAKPNSREHRHMAEFIRKARQAVRLLEAEGDARWVDATMERIQKEMDQDATIVSSEEPLHALKSRRWRWEDLSRGRGGGRSRARQRQ